MGDRLGHERLLTIRAVVVRGHPRVGAGIPAFARARRQAVLMRRHRDVLLPPMGVIQIDIGSGIGRYCPSRLVIRALYERRPLRQPCGQSRRTSEESDLGAADQHAALLQPQHLAVGVGNTTHVNGVLPVARPLHHRYIAQHQLGERPHLDGRLCGAARAALLDRTVSQRHHRLIGIVAFYGQRRTCRAVLQVRRPGVAAQVDGDLRSELLIPRVDAHVLRPVLRQQDRAFPRLAGEDIVHRLLNAVELLHAHQQHVARVAAFAHAVGVRVLVLQHLHLRQLRRAHLLQYGVFPACCILAVERVSLRQQLARRQPGSLNADRLERTVLQLRLAVLDHGQLIDGDVVAFDDQRARAGRLILAQVEDPCRANLPTAVFQCELTCHRVVAPQR